jgi:hypothetical protein
MIETDVKRGKVFPIYYVSCGVCERQSPVGVRVKSQVPKHLVAGGWKYTKQYGYVCWECSKERN